MSSSDNSKNLSQGQPNQDQPNQKIPFRIGLDFGGVCQKTLASSDSDTSNDVATLPLFKNCKDSIQQLIKKYGVENIFIISKAGKQVQEGTLKCLKDNGLLAVESTEETDKFSTKDSTDITNSTSTSNSVNTTENTQSESPIFLLRENIYFTSKRNGSCGKWPLIAKLQLDVFVDDNWSLFCDPLKMEFSSKNCESSDNKSDLLTIRKNLSCIFFVPRASIQTDSTESTNSKTDEDDNNSQIEKLKTEKTTLDRNSDDKKANRNANKCPYACGKEEYYREYSYADEKEKGKDCPWDLEILEGEDKAWKILVAEIMKRSCALEVSELQA